jgi:hypothetical protein
MPPWEVERTVRTQRSFSSPDSYNAHPCLLETTIPISLGSTYSHLLPLSSNLTGTRELHISSGVGE